MWTAGCAAGGPAGPGPGLSPTSSPSLAGRGGRGPRAHTPEARRRQGHPSPRCPRGLPDAHCAAGGHGLSRPRGDEPCGSAGGPPRRLLRSPRSRQPPPSRHRCTLGVGCGVGTLRGCHTHMYRTSVSCRVSTGGAHEPFRDHLGKGDTSPRSQGRPRAVGSGGWQQGSQKADQLGPRVRAGSPGAGPAEPHPGPRSGYLRVSFDLRLGQLISPS